MKDLKNMLGEVEQSLNRIEMEIMNFEAHMKTYLATLSHEMQQHYSLYEDMSKLELDPEDPESLYNRAKSFFPKIYTVDKQEYLNQIRTLVLQISKDMGIFSNDLVGIAYYKFLKTYAAGENGVYLKPGESLKLYGYLNQYHLHREAWSSSDQNVAFLDSFGRVFAVAPGVSEIKVDMDDVEQPYPITVIVENNTEVSTVYLKPENGDNVFQYKAGKTFSLSDLVSDKTLKICDEWLSDNPEIAWIEKESVTTAEIVAPVMCMVSGHVNNKDEEKILCYAVIQLESYFYKDEIHLYCPEDYEYIRGQIKYQKLFMEKRPGPFQSLLLHIFFTGY